MYGMPSIPVGGQPIQVTQQFYTTTNNNNNHGEKPISAKGEEC